MAERTRFVDNEVAGALGRGVDQVVLVGAGYDGRPLRFAGETTTWFEVDRPATQADKQRRLAALGLVPRGVHLRRHRPHAGRPGPGARGRRPRRLTALGVRVRGPLHLPDPRGGGLGVPGAPRPGAGRQRPGHHLSRGARRRRPWPGPPGRGRPAPAGDRREAAERVLRGRRREAHGGHRVAGGPLLLAAPGLARPGLALPGPGGRTRRRRADVWGRCSAGVRRHPYSRRRQAQPAVRCRPSAVASPLRRWRPRPPWPAGCGPPGAAAPGRAGGTHAHPRPRRAL